MKIQDLTALAEREIQGANGSLKDFQVSHLDLFKKNGLRPIIVDSYKFTRPELFFSESEVADVNGSSLVLDSKFPTLFFVNGKFTKSEIKIPGVTVKNLKENFESVKDLFKEDNALSHLHHALLSDGVIIEVDKNIEVGFPIKVQHIVGHKDVSAPVVVMIAKPFSKVSIIEEVSGQTAAYTHLSETYIEVKEGARVEHIQINQESSEGVIHTSVYANAHKDSTIRSFIFNTSGKINRKNLSLSLAAPGAHGESYALYLTNEKEHSDINTVIHHLAPDSTSDQMAKGILDGESKGIFTGKIHIHPKAQRVASGQLNKNLLLSKKAQAHSQPQLEIFADDVKCSHGSTTGQLSDDEVFYFQTRGIPAEKAKTLLAHGFGLEIVQKIENECARDELSELIMKTLEQKFSLGGNR